MKDFENQIRKYLKERGWDNLKPSDLAKSIMIEGAELLEIFQWDNQIAEEVKKDLKKMKKIRKELADIMIYCFEMATHLDIDTEEIINQKLNKIREKYPKELFNPDTVGENPGTESQYWKIKEEYRKAGKN